MGCYPLFTCRDWSLLAADLEKLRGDLVSLSLVADPFGDYEVTQLQRCFDVVTPYKPHFIVDLARPPESAFSRHHRRAVRKALPLVDVKVCADPPEILDEWTRLYANVVERHRVTGIRAFSRDAFAKQLRIPGTVVLSAAWHGQVVAADWYCVQGEVAYAHLSACDPGGYATGAAYALLWQAIEYFQGRVRWLDLGGGAGLPSGESRDGLTRFKRGWSTGTRMAYFCGRVLDPDRYHRTVKERGVGITDYFPAYRVGEFG
jgi:lipid II:glycine glycyltransferase (peptidoglycan interpeptide bridge formation enzyme)